MSVSLPTADGGAYPKGTYEVTVTIGTHSSRCPIPAPKGGECYAGTRFSDSSTIEISIDGAPTAVTIALDVVSDAGVRTTFLSESITPTYANRFPNGEGCGGECRVAKASFATSPPK